MTVPTIVFDLDGTIVDTAPDLLDALAASLAREGLPPVPVEEARNMIGAGARALLERGLRRGGREVGEERLQELLSIFLDHYGRNIAVLSRAFDGLETTLDDLAAAGARLAVCTNKPEGLARQLLDQLRLSRRFAAICGGDTFAARKPDPMHLTGTVERAGGSIMRTVMVGDSGTDLAAGRAAGVPVVLVDFGYTDIPAAELGADLVISHLTALPQAIRILLA